MTNVTINNTQRLFVIESEGGVSCLGFDVVDAQRRYIADKLKLNLAYAQSGALEAYEQHQALVRQWCEKAKEDKSMIFFGSNAVPMKLRRVLRDLVMSNDVVRIMCGDPATGTVWMEENDVIGRIGLSTGPMRVPILVPEGDRYGAPLLCENILMVKDWKTSTVLFGRPFKVPVLDVRVESTLIAGTRHVVHHAGQPQASFESAMQAYAYMAFMTGACVNPVEFQ